MEPDIDLSRPWHALPTSESLTALSSHRDGLSPEDARERLSRFGANRMPEPKARGIGRVFLGQFASPLIYLLFAAAAVSVLLGDWKDSLFILIVLSINATIGAIQEWKAETSARSLQKLIPRHVSVRRAGTVLTVDTANLVPGDIVLLSSGALIPADIRLITDIEARVDESLLTGESLPVTKHADARLSADTMLAERVTMLHAGSILLHGRVEGIVVRTGEATEMGRIAHTLTTQPLPPSPLVLRLDRFTRTIGIVIVAAVCILGAALYFQGVSVEQIFFVAVALAVAAIPEGLPVAITAALAVASHRMAARGVIVRRLAAVEGLGECTVIATDKTGTLTRNVLTVQHVALAATANPAPNGLTLQELDFAAGDLPATDDHDGAENLRRLAICGALANEAMLRPTKNHEQAGLPPPSSDPVDLAFLVFAENLGIHREALLESLSEIQSVPYESARKYAAVIHRERDRDRDRLRISVKGAAEAVLPMCDGVDAAAALAEVDQLAADGFRVLALADGFLPAPEVGSAADAIPLAGLTFLGFAGLIDPVRDEVPAAIERCRKAGIAVRMITGDHPATALAIARTIGLAHDRGDVVTGADLRQLDNAADALAPMIDRASVFARVEPAQKLTIVETLQRSGHFVAVTGDGVNDAPALHAAHIGIAMGKGGTDVARGASDLILTDDNFASIVGGIEEGRVAFNNIRKVIYALISTGMAELVLFFLCLAFALPLPLFAVQLLWLNLVTNGIQNVALAFERAECDVLNRPPRSPDAAIFDRRMIEQVILSGTLIGLAGFAYFDYAQGSGLAEAEVRNRVLLLMVIMTNIHVLNARSEFRSTFRLPLLRNRFLLVAIVSAQLVHAIAMHIPGLNGLLGIQPVPLTVWLQGATAGLALIVCMEGYKLIRRDVPA